MPAVSLAIILTVATTIVNVVLAIDEDETFYDELARRIEGHEEVTDRTRPAGLTIIQIDGLAAPILRNAIRVGTVPRMASWVRSGAYTLNEWECPRRRRPRPARPASCTATTTTSRPSAGTRRRAAGCWSPTTRPTPPRSNGASPMGRGSWRGGSSVGNLFTGDAARSAFVMSRMGDPVGDLDVDAFSLYFMDPASFIRTVVLSIGEFLKELVEARRQRVQDIWPRVHRGTTFAFLRAATNVVLRDLNTTFVVRSMSLGVPVIYTDLVD